MTLLKLLGMNAIGLALGATVAISCTVNYPTVAFRCNPRQADNCPEDYFCCSDDPNPMFSGVNNAQSARGMCVKEGALGAAGLPELPQCPVPCNPTWDANQVASVCGAARQCCQTVEITEKDCVQDQDGTWRPVTGADIPEKTNWAAGAHDTHQDPGGTVCLALAGNDQGSQVFQDCIEQLNVANQRGYCMQLQAGQGCPTAAPEYRDACECLNNPGDPFCLQKNG